MKALVIDGGRNGLGVVRGLEAAGLGLEVHVASPGSTQPARYSRSVAGFWPVPDPASPADWLEAMLALGQRLTDADGPPLLVPVNDVYIILGARYWHRLSTTFRAAFETRPDTLDRCLAKDRCYDLADEVGVAVPARSDSADGFAARGGRLPAIVKPAIRNAPEFAANRPFRARVCATLQDIVAACEELRAAGARPVVQEFIPGGDDTLVTAGVAAVGGRIVATFTGRKLRQFPPQVGEASYAESIDAPDTAASACRMLTGLGFTGLAQVEFKRRDGVDYLLEINPRSWSWIGLTAASGVNLPGALAADLLGRTPSALTPVFGKRWIYSLQDFRYHGRRGGPWNWVRWLGQAIAADSHAHWRLGDPLPALSQSWAWAASRWQRT